MGMGMGMPSEFLPIHHHAIACTSLCRQDHGRTPPPMALIGICHPGPGGQSGKGVSDPIPWRALPCPALPCPTTVSGPLLSHF
ncbi:hypothetical protein V6N11_046842 [Hibiscus sabdariffa]|uniref:Uncharacterized protein n=2 Tax=Hibiscus sabdariffa TaxID=183260 RepID=A0ABR2DFS6_9ROSI